MEPNKPKSGVAFAHKMLALCALTIFPGLQLLAQNSGNSSPDQITAGEIAMYVAIIVVVIGIAWFFASRQTDKLDKEHHEQMMHHTPKKHYDHPNDPHFRKLRKKTS
jgi:hypothetical protein